MNYRELIERLHYERDDGARYEAANAIESLLAENGRLKDELAKYRDAPVVAYRHMMDDGWEYYDAPTGEDCAGCVSLIVKPGE